MSRKKTPGKDADRPQEGDHGPGRDPTQEGPVPGASRRQGSTPQPIGDEPGARSREREETPPYEPTGERPES